MSWGRLLCGLILASAMVSVVRIDVVGAVSLQMTPLEYRSVLPTDAATQKGYVDIRNTSLDTLIGQIEVRGFRQIDTTGALEFYVDEQIEAGIRPELTQFELGPGELLRLYFVVDGTKLPPGDVYAALFASTTSQSGQFTTGAARVGTLMSLVNGRPGERQATVERLTMPFWQISDGMQAQFWIHNTSDPSKATGFYPDIHVRSGKYIDKHVAGPLVFAGLSREVTFKQSGDYLGLVDVQISVGDSQIRQQVFMITGRYRWLLPLGIIGVITAVYMSLHLWHRFRRN